MSVESDLQAMLTGWDSRAVVVGSVSGRGMLQEMDVLDTDRSGDQVLVRKTVVRVRRSEYLDAAGALTVARGDTLALDGTDYTVSDVMTGGYDRGMGGADFDGRVLHLFIRKV